MTPAIFGKNLELLLKAKINKDTGEPIIYRGEFDKMRGEGISPSESRYIIEQIFNRRLPPCDYPLFERIKKYIVGEQNKKTEVKIKRMFRWANIEIDQNMNFINLCSRIIESRLNEVMEELGKDFSIKMAKKKFKRKEASPQLEHLILLIRESKIRCSKIKNIAKILEALKKECFAHVSPQFKKEGKRLLSIYHTTYGNRHPFNCMPRLESLVLYFLSQMGESHEPASKMGNILKGLIEKKEPFDPDFVLSGNTKFLKQSSEEKICTPLEDFPNDFLRKKKLWIIHAFINEESSCNTE